MAIVLNDNQQELIEKHQAHLASERKLDLLLKTIEKTHKHNKFSLWLQKVFKKPCKLCIAVEKVRNG